jgi:16S rRNA (uracil1498-N3)-methyltransferase
MIRLYINADIIVQNTLPLDEKQGHYLRHVMRKNDGDEVLVFNGRDGEWFATLTLTKKQTLLTIQKQTRPQHTEKPLILFFAPIKRGHGDMVIEKATELGATDLYPIITERTIVTRIPHDRYEAIAVEAAEQCERLCVPKIHEAQKLESLIKHWDNTKPIFLCAEEGAATPLANAVKTTPAHALMIGPEGGFSPNEFTMLRKQPFIIPVTLGTRILRADTAAIAALSIVQALR